MKASKFKARLTDSGAREMRRAYRAARGGVKKVPGPSPNPATNLLMADIAMRGATLLFRRALQKGMLQLRFDPERAREIVQGRSTTQTVVSALASRMATRSVPGFVLVSSGLLAKTIVDRSQGRRARLKGERDLAEQAKNAPEDTDEPI